MSQASSIPSIDPHNPFYCPGIPAASFLKSLHLQVQNKPQSTNIDSHKLFPIPRYDYYGRNQLISTNQPILVASFVQILGRAVLSTFHEDDCADFGAPKVIQQASPFSFAPETLGLHSGAPFFSTPVGQSDRSSATPPSDSFLSHRRLILQKLKPEPKALKRKRAETFTDLQGPAKHCRSSITSPGLAYYDHSQKDLRLSVAHSYASPLKRANTEVEGLSVEEKLEKQVRTLKGKSIYAYNSLVVTYCRHLDALYGPSIGSESPGGIACFIQRLDALLPGTRLGDRLDCLEDKSHQSIATYLGQHGVPLQGSFTPSHH